MDSFAKERFKNTVINNFMTHDGRLRQIPAQYKKKLVILEHLAERLEEGRVYPEQEINAYIQHYHADYATIRREFINHGYMSREREMYVRNPRERWTSWERL